MGVRGPVPKRTSERLGHLTKAERASSATVDVAGPVIVPPPDETWHPLASEWYLSLAESGQKKFFEPSDWAAARLVAFEMTRMLADAPSPTQFKAIWTAMGELLTTEGARRRVKVEISRKPLAAAPASVANLADFRDL